MELNEFTRDYEISPLPASARPQSHLMKLIIFHEMGREALNVISLKVFLLFLQYTVTFSNTLSGVSATIKEIR